MENQLGLLFALVALLGWGFGDFFIQKTARLMGPYRALFCICAGGGIALFPFIYREIPTYTSEEYWALAILSGIIFVYALALFEAFRRGKLSVVESVVAFELPFTVSLAVFIGSETLSWSQLALIFIIFIGIALAAAARLDHLHYHKRILEKGVALAFVGAILSAITNFYIGTYSQHMSPLFVIWATHSMLAIMCGMYMLMRGEFSGLVAIVRKHPVPVIAQSVLDNVAWIGYAFAASMIPISFTVAITESYIALAALLGYFLGKEKLRRHQIVGAAIACIGAVVLAAVVGE